MSRPELEPDVVERLRAICDRLPAAEEQDAWVGVRYRIRGRTFAHLCPIDGGRPEAMSRHAGTAGPAVVLTFESAGEELGALRQAGHPFWVPPWRESVVGLFIEASTDWQEVAELVTESYCVQAPRYLTEQVRRIGPAGSPTS